MTIAPSAALATPPRMRIHSFAVWDSAVFLLNVLAFLLMGFQARTIIDAMMPERLADAAWFAAIVVLCLIVVRLAWVLAYNRLAFRFKPFRGDIKPATLRHGVLIGWCGMRGLVTLATAFALPSDFPQRDLIVLTAFAVVLATLVIQGLTIAPIIRLLKLDSDTGLHVELAEARAILATSALSTLQRANGRAAEHWRYAFETARSNATTPDGVAEFEAVRRLGLAAVRRQREILSELRRDQRVGADAFLVLQEELDFQEVSLVTEPERHIREG